MKQANIRLEVVTNLIASKAQRRERKEEEEKNENQQARAERLNMQLRNKPGREPLRDDPNIADVHEKQNDI